MPQRNLRIVSPIPADKPPISVRLMRVSRTYSEIIWSVKSGFEEKRQANTCLGNKKIDEPIAKELSKEAGRSPGRIKKFLVQAEFLTKECLTELSISGADEDFFDAVQPVKRILVKNMLSRGSTQAEMEKEISGAILEMWEEYQHTEKVNRKRWLKMRNGKPGERRGWVSGKEIFGKPLILKYKTPSSVTPRPSSLTIEDIRGTLGELAAQIREIVERAQDKHANLAEDTRKLMMKTAKLYFSVSSRADSKKEKAKHETLH